MEIEVVYPPAIERYRQVLLEGVQAINVRAEAKMSEARLTDEIIAIGQHAIYEQQPLLEELARVHTIHAQYRITLND